MKKFIAAAAFAAAPWLPAHAQTILGSIPEEFRGDWCWQETAKGQEIFKSGDCKLKAGSLSIGRMTLDTGRLSCGFDSGAVTRTPLRCRCSAPIPRISSRRCTVPNSRCCLARKSNSSSSRWINGDERVAQHFGASSSTLVCWVVSRNYFQRDSSSSELV